MTAEQRQAAKVGIDARARQRLRAAKKRDESDAEDFVAEEGAPGLVTGLLMDRRLRNRILHSPR